jgi:Ca2+-binding EF-hand superfamily protein
VKPANGSHGGLDSPAAVDVNGALARRRASVLHSAADLQGTKTMNRRELVEALFEEFDDNGDGVLSRREFNELIDAMIGTHGAKTHKEIFDRFDRDHDNGISKDELVELVIEYAL